MKRILIVFVAFVLIIPCLLSRAEEDPVGIINDQFIEELYEGGLVELKKEIIQQRKTLQLYYHLRTFVAENLSDKVLEWYDREIALLEAKLLQNKKLYFEAIRQLEIKHKKILKKKKKLLKFNEQHIT